MIAPLIIVVNTVVAAICWAPAIVKILRTHSSRDYSLTTMLLILWLQVSNCGIAVARGQGWAIYWFGFNSLTVLIITILVGRFRNGPKAGL